MSVWHQVFMGLVEVGKARYGQAVNKAKLTVPIILLMVISSIVALWGLGLLVAAIFLAVLPHIGAAAAAVISALCAFAIASIVAAIAVRAWKQ